MCVVPKSLVFYIFLATSSAFILPVFSNARHFDYNVYVAVSIKCYRLEVGVPLNAKSGRLVG